MDTEVRDKLPTDLDVHGYVGPYQFPDNSRRRIPGILYLAIFIVIIFLNIFLNDPLFINKGSIIAAIGLVLVAFYHVQASWSLKVDEVEALLIAGRVFGFPVGHASAQMVWRGLRSRPTWRILIYSNELLPENRGFVIVDGVDGSVIASHFEDNPEVWEISDSRFG